eukprot:gene5511-9328_t
MSKRKFEEVDPETTISENKPKQTFQQTFTITFGDCGENHVRMQKVGEMDSEGFNKEDLISVQKHFEQKKIETELINLNEALSKKEKNSSEEAYILILRNALNTIVSSEEFYKEQNDLKKDKQALMYGRVVNKSARYNLCFGEEYQQAEYKNGKGTIISFNNVPLLSKVRDTFEEILKGKCKKLVAEGNYYFDVSNCGIGFHGDSERRKVIGVRVGETLPLHYQWFKDLEPIGERVKLSLGHGDIYLMSEKAVGTDWKKKSILTLRHAAGAEKFLTIKKKNRKKKLK